MTNKGACPYEPRKIGRQVEAKIGRRGGLHRCEDRHPLDQGLDEFRTALRHRSNFNVGYRPQHKYILAAGGEVHGRRHAIADIHPPDGEGGKWRSDDTDRRVEQKTDLRKFVRPDHRELSGIERRGLRRVIGFRPGSLNARHVR